MSRECLFIGGEADGQFISVPDGPTRHQIHVVNRSGISLLTDEGSAIDTYYRKPLFILGRGILVYVLNTLCQDRWAFDRALWQALVSDAGKRSAQ